MKTKINRDNCPKECVYRNKLAPFCGYCLSRIMRELEEEKNGTKQKQTADAE